MHSGRSWRETHAQRSFVSPCYRNERGVINLHRLIAQLQAILWPLAEWPVDETALERLFVNDGDKGVGGSGGGGSGARLSECDKSAAYRSNFTLSPMSLIRPCLLGLKLLLA